jgi:micrococcal nuclease
MPLSALPKDVILVKANVVRVIDGDTIEVDVAIGGRATLRFIGVDTPETVAPGRPVDCFGPEASANTKQLLEGKTVFLEKDVSQTDRFQRLLRYVYLEDGRMVNELIVRDGFAQVATFPPDVKYQQRFLAAQLDARNANRGLWGQCNNASPPGATPAVAPATPIGGPGGGRPVLVVPTPGGAVFTPPPPPATVPIPPPRPGA